MKILSVNVGLPRDVIWKGKSVTTSIFKEPVEGRQRVDTLNIEGDRQSDLTVHGGIHKAVYAYPSEHYDWWRGELPGVELPWGMFGENLTVAGLSEDDVCVGDQFLIGSALLMVTQPRLPCYKLAVKFGRDDIIKQFLDSRRTGFYFSVVKKGDLAAGDSIEIITRGAHELKVADVTRLYLDDNNDIAALQKAVSVESLPKSWREHFKKQLARLETR